MSTPINPKPMGQIISCFPITTPETKASAGRKPNRAPVAIKAIFAGPGVPTCDAKNIIIERRDIMPKNALS